MINQKTHLKVEVENREFEFFCDVDSPITSAYQAIEILRNYMLGKIRDAEEQAKSKEDSPCQ